MLIVHEGVVLDQDGLPLEGDEIRLELALYDEARQGERLWSAVHETSLVMGYYTVAFEGDEILEEALLAGETYLGISVNGEAEVLPRRPLRSVPWARVAKTAAGDITPRSVRVGPTHIDPQGRWAGPTGEFVAAVKATDGTGSGLDADRLDGHDSTELLRRAATDAPLRVVSLLVSEDGAGSGVDADELDGLHGSKLMRVDADTGTSGGLAAQGDVAVAGAAFLAGGADVGGPLNAGEVRLRGGGRLGVGVDPEDAVHVRGVLRATSLQVDPLAFPPADPQLGSIYLDEETGLLRLFDGQRWVTVGGGSGGDDGSDSDEPVEPEFPDADFRRNCTEIEKTGGSVGDGRYTIDPNGGSSDDAFTVFCDMTTDGGGWTLLGHYRHPASVEGPAGHDDRDYALYMRARTSATYGKEAHIADPDSPGPWTDWRALDNVNWPLEVAVVFDMDAFSTDWDVYGPKVIYLIPSREAMPNYGTTQDLIGVRVKYRFDADDEWKDVGGNSASGTYYWYPRDHQGQYLSLFHVSNYQYLDGRDPTDYHHATYYGAGVPGGNNSWHHGARILVRESKVQLEQQIEQEFPVYEDAPVGKTCREILEAGGSQGDGVYTIDPSGQGSREDGFAAFCDMQTDGGGWTMVSHYRHPANFNGPEGHEDRDYALYMRARNDEWYGVEEYLARPDSPGPWADWRVLAGMEFPVELAVVVDMFRYEGRWDDYPRKVLYYVRDRVSLPNWGTSQDLIYGQVKYRFDSAAEFVDVGYGSTSGTYYWYPRDQQDRYLSLFHVSNYFYLDGRGATNYHHGVYLGAGMPGGNNSWHHGAKLFVRQTELIEDEEEEFEDEERVVIEAPIHRHCKAILQAGDSEGDGIYLVDPSGQASEDDAIMVWCDMTTDGGGWNLVSRYRHPAHVNGPPGHENRDYALYMRGRRDEAYGREEYLALPNSRGPWADWRSVAGMTWPAELAVILDMRRFETPWHHYPKKVVYRVKSRDVLPNWGTSQDLLGDDNLLYRFEFADPWTDVGESTASGTYYWYPRSERDEYLTLFHVSNYAYLDGRAPTNYHHACYYGSGVPGGNNSWHHGAHLLLRPMD